LGQQLGAGEKKARSMYAKMTKSLGTGREATGDLQSRYFSLGNWDEPTNMEIERDLTT